MVEDLDFKMLLILQKVLSVIVMVFITVECTHRSSGASEGETQQHKQGDKFLSALHVGHAE